MEKQLETWKQKRLEELASNIQGLAPKELKEFGKLCVEWERAQELTYTEWRATQPI